MDKVKEGRKRDKSRRGSIDNLALGSSVRDVRVTATEEGAQDGIKEIMENRKEGQGQGGHTLAKEEEKAKGTRGE